MKYNVKDNVKYITFDIFNKYDFINAVFSTKQGGVSKGYFSTMNLSFSRGDNFDDVKENYVRFCKATNITLKNMIMSDQVHKTDIFVVRDYDTFDKDIDFSNRKLENIDGMITNIKNIPLFTYYADCVPLFFVDPIHKACGVAHSGWRGTQKGMGKCMVDAMKREYNSKPEDIVCAIGPSICKDCYEVSKDVYDAMYSSYNDIFDVDSVFIKKENEKFNLDLWELNKLILMSAGVKEENIEISKECTCCNKDILFSHRATNGKRGNLCGCIEII